MDLKGGIEKLCSLLMNSEHESVNSGARTETLTLLSVEPRDFSNLMEKLRVLRFTLASNTTSLRFLLLYTSIVPQIQFFVCLQGSVFKNLLLQGWFNAI